MYRDDRASSSSGTPSSSSAESTTKYPDPIITTGIDIDHEDTNNSDDPHDEGAGAGSGAGHGHGAADGAEDAKSATSSSNKKPPSERVIIRRRGHFKSRLGCFSCKRRRVKCDEFRPACSPCRRLGLTCEYPTASPAQVAAMSGSGAGFTFGAGITSSSSSSSSSSGPGSVTPLTVNPAMFSLQDLRFYHQFLTVGFPTLPLKAPEVWSQCAAMSHQYDHLAHAILGLGASHVSQNSGLNPATCPCPSPTADFTSPALQHRVTAIELFNKQLSQPCRSAADADALFATVVCLVAQSSLMPHTMNEYLTMTRGGNLVASTLLRYEESVFRDFTHERHLLSVMNIVSEDEPRDFKLIDGCTASLLKMRTLCKNIYEVQYWDAMYRATVALRTSSLAAWKCFIEVFIMPSLFSNEEFQDFTRPDNHRCQLLIIHSFLVEYVCGRFCLPPSESPPCPGRKNMVIAWARNLAAGLPEAYRKYMEWPLEFCELLETQDARYLLSP